MISLTEGFNLNEYLFKNQVIELPRVGWYKPYTAVTITAQEDGGLYTLESYNDGGLYIDDLIDDSYLDMQEVLEGATERLGKMGFKRQNVKVIFMDIQEHLSDIAPEADQSKEYDGFAVPSSPMIIIDKQLLFENLNHVEGVIVHETAHSLWYQFNKDTKQWFIDWYGINVLNKIIQGKLEDDDIDLIWNAFEGAEGSPSYLIKKVIPDLILDVFETKYGDIKDDLIINPVKKAFERAFRQKKSSIQNEKIFKEILTRMKFKFSGLESQEASKLRAIAYEKGLTPSEYAGKNPGELWAETVRYASEPNNSVSAELKKALISVISGTV